MRWHKMDSQHNDPAASGTAHPEAGKKHRWARPHKAETGHLAPQPVVPQPAMPLGGGPSRTSAYGGAAPLGAPGGSGVGVGAGAGAPGGLAPAARPAAPGGYPGAGGAGGQYAPQFGGMPGGAPQSGVAVGVPAGGAAAYGTAPGAAQGEAPRRPSVARSTISFSGAPVPVGNYPEGEATYAPDSRFAPLSLPDDIASAAEGSATSTAESENEPAYNYTPALDLVAEIDVNQTFGERIENLISIAVAEADAMREDAIADAKRERHDAKLDSERMVAAAQRQAAEIVAAAQRRAEGDVQAAVENRQVSEAELTQAHSEAEVIRRRARDEATELRHEIDAHAQALLARTHEDTNRTLVAARAELEHLQSRKLELEHQLAQLRAMLSEAMSPTLPALHDILGTPNPTV